MNEVTTKPLDTTVTSNDVYFRPTDNRRLAMLCGKLDENLRLIEKVLNVAIHPRGNRFVITGEAPQVVQTTEILNDLYHETRHLTDLPPAQVHLAMQAKNNQNEAKETPTTPKPLLKTKHQKIVPRGRNQSQYIERILNHDINFAIGPAGTGKTYLAVACAVAALEEERINRILLVRPAVEAGERLGFLPGDLTQKVDPYLRPLYDALYEMLGFECVTKYIERGIIEIAPLAYMRGRTLNDSFIILDESQNTTREQMKMFLTRIGFNSVVVVTGDVTQIDLPKASESGLKHAIDVLHQVDDISFTFFGAGDVVRHPLIQKIVRAYHHYENTSDQEAPKKS